jgi:hypothetical protein
MKITKVESVKKSDLNFEDALSSVKQNRERLRSLNNMVLSSCSIFLSISFVIFFFIVKEAESTRFSSIVLLLVSDLMFIAAIFFCIISVYINQPKPITTKLSLLSQESYYLIKEQKNARTAIVFLFVGILILMTGLVLFAINYIR